MKRIFFLILFCGIFISSFLIFDSALAALPDKPSLYSPVNGAMDVSLTPNMRWRTSSGATHYDLHIANGGSWVNLSGFNYTLQPEEALSQSTTYTWWVRACNTEGCRSSDQWSFTTLDAGGSKPVMEGLTAIPEIGGSVGQGIVVNAAASDDQGVKELYVDFGDGSGWVPCDQGCSGGKTCSCAWTHPYSQVGNYWVQAFAVDTSDQSSYAERTAVFITEEGEVPPSGGTPGGGGMLTLENPLGYDNFQDILGAVSKFLFQIGLALAPVMLIIAGFMFVTAAGSPERVTSAKKMALYTLIGLAIILLASGLIAVLKSVIGYTG